jgi:N4-gp56 family major capsid protein
MRTSDIANLIVKRIDRKLVETLEKNFVLADLGQPRLLRKNEGDTVQVHFWDNPTASTLASDELAGASENSLSFTTATVTVLFYSNDFAFSEFAEAIDVSGSIESGYVGRAIYNINEVIDTIVRDSVDSPAAASTRVANGKAVASSITTADTINMYELNFITTTLEGRNVRAHPKGMGGYCGVFHTQQIGDLRADTGGSTNPQTATWYDMARRNDPAMFRNGTVGQVLNITVKRSTNIQRQLGATAGDVPYYNSFVFGNEAFMITSINGLSQPGTRGGRPLVKIIPAEMNHATPLGNKHRVVWKMYFGSAPIDDTRYFLFQSASSA